MAEEHIIIIGAGAAGLMAAKELAAKGKKVTILEAQHRLGGRIHTLHAPEFSVPIELGAEFVHGDLPHTLALLREAGIPYHTTSGAFYRVNHHKAKETEHFVDHWPLFEKRLKELETDMTIEQFLETHFNEDKFESLRESVRGYAAGYDNADPGKASIFAMRDEWIGEDDASQYRIDGGYQQLINYLSHCCTAQGCNIYMCTEVTTVTWTKHHVSISTKNGEDYRANKVVITVPLGVLQANDVPGAIAFSPALPRIAAAISHMGYGAVIKILLHFSNEFWQHEGFEKQHGKKLEDISFILSDETIPTWWTQNPAQSPLLTGWLGGPVAAAVADAADETILEAALASIAGIFNLPLEYVKQQLTASKVVNWTRDVYARGSYSYATVETKSARQILAAPIEDTIYFAGEALYDGPEMGTVEAALSSGVTVARQIPA